MENKIKVLIGDNSEGLGKACEAGLRAYNFEVLCEAKDGSKILEQIDRFQPDVVLMEAFMVHRDALSVMQEVLRGGRPHHKPSFFVMSSTDNQRLESSLLAGGADYYFLKDRKSVV